MFENQSNCHGTNAVSTTHVTDSTPTAPLVKVTLRLTPPKDQPHEEAAKNADPEGRTWFEWDEPQLISCPSAIMVCRAFEFKSVGQDMGDKYLLGHLVVFLSVHPVNNAPLNQEVLKLELEEALLRQMSRHLKSSSRRLEITIKSFTWDPGIVRTSDVHINKPPVGGPRITLAKSYDWDVKTCYLTGQHFYPPAPLGFFYDGDPTKPVEPLVARKLGFTIDAYVLCGIVTALNTAESLTWFPDHMQAASEEDDRILASCNDASDEMFWKWGGMIRCGYRTIPAIEPNEIPKAIAQARGEPPPFETVRQFLKRPSI